MTATINSCQQLNLIKSVKLPFGLSDNIHAWPMLSLDYSHLDSQGTAGFGWLKSYVWNLVTAGLMVSYGGSGGRVEVE